MENFLIRRKDHQIFQELGSLKGSNLDGASRITLPSLSFLYESPSVSGKSKYNSETLTLKIFGDSEREVKKPEDEQDS